LHLVFLSGIKKNSVWQQFPSALILSFLEKKIAQDGGAGTSRRVMIPAFYGTVKFKQAKIVSGYRPVGSLLSAENFGVDTAYTRNVTNIIL